MGALSPMHLIAILVVALLVLGPGKLPESGEALGKAVREFRRAIADEPPAAPPVPRAAPPMGSAATAPRPESDAGYAQEP